MSELHCHKNLVKSSSDTINNDPMILDLSPYSEVKNADWCEQCGLNNVDSCLTEETFHPGCRNEKSVIYQSLSESYYIILSQQCQSWCNLNRKCFSSSYGVLRRIPISVLKYMNYLKYPYSINYQRWLNLCKFCKVSVFHLFLILFSKLDLKTIFRCVLKCDRSLKKTS